MDRYAGPFPKLKIEGVTMRSITVNLALVCSILWAGTIAPYQAGAAELKLFDGRREAVLIEGFKDGNLTVFMSSGEKKTFALREVATIYYSGRPDHFIRTGDQKFIFNAGGHICAAVEKLREGEILDIKSRSLGRHIVPLKKLHGFTALAIQGRASRMADDLMREDDLTPKSLFLDKVLDRRGVPYAGVVESFSPIRLEFEHDEQLQQVRIDTFKIAGVRLAEADKLKSKAGDVDALQVGVRCRDGSYLVGSLLHADPFQWQIQPNWDTSREIGVPTNEISKVDVLGGRTVFLTQLKPTAIKEKTIVAPPQPYRKNSNTQGESLDIGGFIYHNGLGVHARSELTYDLGGKFKTFEADVGIDGRLEKEGSVIFKVKCDGAVKYTSPLVRGKVSGGGLQITVPVAGVKKLTLLVEATDDLDQADMANWGGARITRD